MKPLVGISCCTKAFGLYGTPNHAASDTYVRAVDQVMGAVPVLVPANGEAADIGTLLRCTAARLMRRARPRMPSGTPSPCG